MSEPILQPISLAAILLVCNDMPADEQATIEATTGVPYNADHIAHLSAGYAGPAWTIEADGFPIVVGGFIPLRTGVYRSWCYATEAAWERHGQGVTRIVRELLSSMLLEHAHRVETLTLASRSHAQRWYGTIGLSFESTLPQYGANREDAVLYSALRKEIK